jgi:aminoglycoside/choline kinase family phosphotransferase
MISDRRTTDVNGVRARIDQFLAETGVAQQGPKVVPLTGDAGDRRYFRVLMRNGRSQVLAVHPGGLEFEKLPFANVYRLLTAMPVPVPRIIAHSRQAVTLVETLQRRGAELASIEYIPYAIAFDVEKLTWELQFFAKHFLEAYRGATLTQASRDALSAEFMTIAEELASEPRVLCHRDYHSRNLMLHEGTLHIIDFQDARMGPDTYDLVSLLRDSYIDLTEGQVEQLIAFFLALRGSRGDGAAAGDEQAFRRRFDLMALQRNLKALGTFGFQTTSKGNTVYIQYIPRTLKYARNNLERYPRFGRLRELLAEHLDELR